MKKKKTTKAKAAGRPAKKPAKKPVKAAGTARREIKPPSRKRMA